MSKIRFSGDIRFEDLPVTPGQICNVQVGPTSPSCNFLQYNTPLTPKKPYFSAQIRTLGAKSRIVVGIAGPNIRPDAQPGHWLDSVGYHSDTGQCYTSHHCVANTQGEKFGIGDVFGVLVTYFGQKKSTVMFLKNGNPVATRFLFESDHHHFLPTMSLENGPMELGLLWPEAAISNPKFSEKNMLHWIKPPTVTYDVASNIFHYTGQEAMANELLIQSPHPLSEVIQHFEVIIQDSLEGVSGPSICLATCSPNKPTPSSTLCQDYIRFNLKFNTVKNIIGRRIGGGILYDPDLQQQPNFNPKAEQLVYCYTTADSKFIQGQIMMQPEGGLYPIVYLQQGASRVTIDIETNVRPDKLFSVISDNFKRNLSHATEMLQEDRLYRGIKDSMLRKSPDIEFSIDDHYCTFRLPATKPGIHVVQFTKPLNKDSNYFFIRLKQLHKNSEVGIGVAAKCFELNEFPGRTWRSVGYTSRDGKLFRNGRNDGNMQAQVYGEGDIVGLEMEVFAKEMSIALFSKNMQPVGTAYYTQPDRTEFLPTIALCSNGHDVVVQVCWPNMTRGAPVFSVVNLNHWCLPPGSVVDRMKNTVYVENHSVPISIQAPYSLHKGYDHFELLLTKEFGPNELPPAIALCTATPLDPPPKSSLKQDFIRFWAVGIASTVVKVGDMVGWGVMYIDESLPHEEEQLVVCYFTINRNIVLVRAVYQPPGGFYPLVVLPPGLNEVTMDFSGTIIRKHPITEKDVEILLKEVEDIKEIEYSILSQGLDPAVELRGENLFKSLPSARNVNTKIEGGSITNETTLSHSSIIGSGMTNNFEDGDQKGSKSCGIL